MITSNVWTRVLRIKFADGHGTCFTIDVDDRQYLVTAKHVVEGIKNSDTVELFRRNTWHRCDVRLVGTAPGDADVVVLSPEVQLSQTFDLPATAVGIGWSQDVYFLGFPYDMYMEVGEFGDGLPIPFVKKAILSSSTKGEYGMGVMYLDGHNNPGFSGGPVVWKKPKDARFSVAGIVSGFRYERQPIYAGNERTQLWYEYNTGIIAAYSTDYAIKLIQDNPIGVQLP